ncbi:MAG TPA: hypothetical protein VMQ76_00610 [Terracidiphilus sp.]|nr:hypothetical protein [Terracidiphilus sp.]
MTSAAELSSAAVVPSAAAAAPSAAAAELSAAAVGARRPLSVAGLAGLWNQPGQLLD